ncbi:MAG: nuclear transport factor 2 family protein [Pseudanabaenaceae cyanobacterium]
MTAGTAVGGAPAIAQTDSGRPAFGVPKATLQNQTPAGLPPSLVEAIADLDAAASRKDLATILNFYAADFRHGDGLTKKELERGVRDLWQRFGELTYRTTVESWEADGDNYRVRTRTEFNGTQTNNPKADRLTLTGTVVSEQVYRAASPWQMVSQQVLTEQTRLTAGERPPELDWRAPQVIGVGRDFALEAVVREPLNTDLLLGAVFDEPINSQSFTRDRALDLQPLRAGGLYRIGRAPFRVGDRWVSAVIVRETGMVIVGQRMRVTDRGAGEQYQSLPDLGPVRSRIAPPRSSQPNS